MDIIWTGAFVRRIIYNRIYTRKDDQVASDGTRFTHIAVNDDEDDIVIQAGAPAAEPPVTAVQPEESPAPLAAEGEAEGEAEGPASAAGDVSDEPAPDDAPEPAAPADDPSPATPDDDLAAPMSTMQKVIIAIALVLVILFVVYCNLPK